jgi:hypothetical protein
VSGTASRVRAGAGAGARPPAPLVVALLLLVGWPTLARAERIRGVTVSTHRGGQEWGSDAIRPTFERLKELGANWVAIHPYARIDADGSVRFRPFDPADPPPALGRPIREAHALGLKILVIPHLAYWGSPFSWRGEIAFASEAEWRRFFDEYERWIVTLAAATRGADGFSIGNELDRTTFREADWRRLIAAVRRVTPAPLTYASNWADFERVGFWDALDVIGVQAYFPLAARPDPTEAELRTSWQRVSERLRRFSERQGRHVVLTELGYTAAWDAPVRPWAFGTDGPEAERVAQACLRVALDTIEREPRIIGAFLWKWFPEPRPLGRDFQLATPGMMRVIREAWRPGAWSD